MDGKYVSIPNHALESTSAAFSDGSPIYLYRHGNICSLIINVTTKADMNAWTTIATIPERFRPAMAIFFANMLGGSLYTGLTLNTDGTIVSSLNIPAGCGLWATVTYIAGYRN